MQMTTDFEIFSLLHTFITVLRSWYSVTVFQVLFLGRSYKMLDFQTIVLIGFHFILKWAYILGEKYFRSTVTLKVQHIDFKPNFIISLYASQHLFLWNYVFTCPRVISVPVRLRHRIVLYCSYGNVKILKVSGSSENQCKVTLF